MTKRRDVVSLLEAYGFISMGGAKHEVFIHPDGRRTCVPRHRDIKELTFSLILKQARIQRRRG